MTKPSEAELIQRCLDGDSTAWEMLYKSYYSRVRRVIGWKRWGFSVNEVEDAVQEVFLELVRSLPRFRGDAKLGTFLDRLARNRCISNLRRKTALKRGQEELGYELEEGKGHQDGPRALAVEPGPGPEELVMSDDDAGRVMDCLEALGGDCQQIIKLRYYRELSYNEICDILELPLGTVCSRLKRCLTKLRAKLEKKEKV
ncbi:MAG: RNA polymerase sigma factor [Vulcanimicrobiota bacterium]